MEEGLEQRGGVLDLGILLRGRNALEDVLNGLDDARDLLVAERLVVVVER